MEFPELSDKIYEGIPSNQKIADSIVKGILKLREDIVANETEIRNIALLIKEYCDGETATVAGAYLLNFVYDSNKIAYHSKPETWQKYFGYNDFYDEFFRITSNMNNLPFEFSTASEEYVLWLWKGDYWNLHSGAEIGLYQSPVDYSDTKHYDAIDFTVPMTLSLYNYYGSSNIDNIFSWAPAQNQWWITGFSGQKEEYLNPNPDDMVMIGSVDLSGNIDMYNALKIADKSYKEDKKNSYDKYLIFDDESSKVWIVWYN